MAPKRSYDEEQGGRAPKKHRPGFKVGPDNLPDGVHRRKVIKIKRDLIHKAKIMKSYKKVKSQDNPSATTEPRSIPEPASQELHPDRQAALDQAREDTPPREIRRPNSHQNQRRKPSYFEKEQAYAAEKKANAEAKRAEFEKRAKEKAEKVESREKFRKAMAKARTGGKNGQRKLGRESKVLLERVKQVVGS